MDSIGHFQLFGDSIGLGLCPWSQPPFSQKMLRVAVAIHASHAFLATANALAHTAQSRERQQGDPMKVRQAAFSISVYSCSDPYDNSIVVETVCFNLK